MKTITMLAVSTFLVSCNKFDKDNLLTNKFGVDLLAISSGKKSQYSDGLFLVYNVTELVPRDHL